MPRRLRSLSSSQPNREYLKFPVALAGLLSFGLLSCHQETSPSAGNSPPPDTVAKGDTTEARVAKILTSILKVAPDRLTPEKRISQDLKADSLDIVEMVMALEEEFHIEIPDREAEKFRTVDDVTRCIRSHMKTST